MTHYSNYILLIPLLPLAAFIFLGLAGKKIPGNYPGIIATCLMCLAALFSIYTALQYFFSTNSGVSHEAVLPFQLTWLRFNDHLSINMGVLLDPISVMMLVVITFVSLMVHVFSLWYMKGEQRPGVYYAFLGLFTFSMLGLVMSTNIFQLYMFWELVGVSSYLLIGFYYEKPSAVAAAKKAFIVTRFADFAFLIGILILGLQAGTLDFRELIQRLTDPASSEFISSTSQSFLGLSFLTWGLLLVFTGGAGKSAMLPFHIWLPDAMEGPTPVSALIHAATMVVAGVFLVARLFPVYQLNHVSLEVVMYVGMASALFAAIIACTQTDIKRVLAFSTMSQIGFMMLALGVSGMGGEKGLGYTASMFHLFTHAFFKSLLFLAAGSIIHFIHSNDLKVMGGLRKLLPLTHLVFLIACLAISGIPPFSGFFSKEEILLAAYQSNRLVYIVALCSSGLTAFYMFRLYFSIFWNRETILTGAHSEGSASMKVPLILLAVLAVIGGFVPFGLFITSDRQPLETIFHISFSLLPVAIATAGILLAAFLYKNKNDKPGKIASAFSGIYRAACRKFYFDEIYLFITRKIIFNLIGRPAAWIDKALIDGTMNGIATMITVVSSAVKRIQSGKVQYYALYFFGGILALGILFIYIWK